MQQHAHLFPNDIFYISEDMNQQQRGEYQPMYRQGIFQYRAIKRYEMDWNCRKLVDLCELSSIWTRTFLLHADWAMGIPEFNAFPREDQSLLFKRNYPGFCWFTHAYKCYVNGQGRIGIPCGNGSYIPYHSYEFSNTHPMVERIYVVVIRRLIDQVVIPMFEMSTTFEEYCILKALALFQNDVSSTTSTTTQCFQIQGKLQAALTFISRNLSPDDQTKRMKKMTTMLANLMDIGCVECENIHLVVEENKHKSIKW